MLSYAVVPLPSSKSHAPTGVAAAIAVISGPVTTRSQTRTSPMSPANMFQLSLLLNRTRPTTSGPVAANVDGTDTAAAGTPLT